MDEIEMKQVAPRVYLESGKKFTFAGALDWPGWCRRGREEGQALQTLVDYGDRYAAVLEGSGLDFIPTNNVAKLAVVERLPGNAVTDFGAPDAMPAQDLVALDAAAVHRHIKILEASWSAFDTALAAAVGRELRQGPRGGGRDRARILEHVLMADISYLRRVGWKHDQAPEERPESAIKRIRMAILTTLEKAAAGHHPNRGPRGGVIWPPHYFVRRVAWHILDHAWEIEDRILPDQAEI
jgi:hypothetical protein